MYEERLTNQTFFTTIRPFSLNHRIFLMRYQGVEMYALMLLLYDTHIIARTVTVGLVGSLF